MNGSNLESYFVFNGYDSDCAVLDGNNSVLDSTVVLDDSNSDFCVSNLLVVVAVAHNDVVDVVSDLNDLVVVSGLKHTILGYSLECSNDDSAFLAIGNNILSCLL